MSPREGMTGQKGRGGGGGGGGKNAFLPASFLCLLVQTLNPSNIQDGDLNVTDWLFVVECSHTKNACTAG